MSRARAVRVAVAVCIALALAACTTNPPDVVTTPETSALPVDLLHNPGAARRALAAIEERVGATPAHVTQITIYPEYMIVEAQDPNVPDHIDTYTWRDDQVSAPEPVHLSGPQEDVDASLFPTTAVDLGRLPSIVRVSEQELAHAQPVRIEQATATYLYIERSSSLDGRVTINLSIDGPRRSGYVETTSSGEILSATVELINAAAIANAWETYNTRAWRNWQTRRV